jgi:outer membrane lipopolysaccharide assembly protein LptE/RlpB
MNCFHNHLIEDTITFTNKEVYFTQMVLLGVRAQKTTQSILNAGSNTENLMISGFTMNFCQTTTKFLTCIITNNSKD